MHSQLPAIDVLPDAQRDEQIFRERKKLLDDAIASFNRFDENAGEHILARGSLAEGDFCFARECRR